MVQDSLSSDPEVRNLPRRAGERDPFEDILRPTCRIPMSNPQEVNSSSSKVWEVTTLQPVALVKQIAAPEMPRSLFRESKPDVILAG